jgi:ribose 1,5-bisphosphokinase
MLIGPGHLVLIVGPSGAGKDSVIARARLIAGCDVHFPLRIVTRRSDPTEETQFVSLEDFERMEAVGALALSWRAHGLAYGLPISIDPEIESGRTVVANVSRAIIAAARRRYRHCNVVLITVDAETRARRLAERGRETDEERSQRLARETSAAGDFKPDLTIENDGALEQAAQRLLIHLTSLAGRH